ncbi:hypothetical protein ZWY2020_052127 [Hordeum vulgare]|nr:hypothetical protein ZWY2020_052127 [Hordeum vulgare]
MASEHMRPKVSGISGNVPGVTNGFRVFIGRAHPPGSQPIDAQQGKLLSSNTTQQPHVTIADKKPNWLDCEHQVCELRRYQSIQSQKSSNGSPDAYMYCKPKMRDDVTTKCASSTTHTCCIVSADGHNTPQPVAVVKNIKVSIGSSAASNTSGITRSTQVNMMEPISVNSPSNNNSTPEHWPMENKGAHFDTKGAEAKNHDDFLTRNKSSRMDFDSVRLAAPLVFNEKYSTAPNIRHLPGLCISDACSPGSTILAKVTSVTGFIVCNIMLDEVPLTSVNQEWAVPAKEAHDTTTSPLRPISNDSVMCKSIKQTNRKEEHAEGGLNGMVVAAVIHLSGMLQNLAKPAEYFNVVDVIPQSSDQWQYGDVQFESKFYGGTEDRSKLTEMMSLPNNTWENHSATDSPRRYHVGSRIFLVLARASRSELTLLRIISWMPKYISHPHSNAQDDGVFEWMHDSHQVLLDMDNSQGFDSKATQIADGDAGMDVQGGEGNVGMSFGDENLFIWNETVWEYQPFFPAPHHLGQQHGGDTTGDSQRARGRRSEYHYPKAVRSRDVAPDIQWNPCGADNYRYSAYSRVGMHTERRYYI